MRRRDLFAAGLAAGAGVSAAQAQGQAALWENPVRKTLKEGKPVVGATITVPSADIAARMATLVILWWILRRLGMSVDRGLVLLAALPLLLPVSPGLTLLALALALSGRVGALACFSRRESRRLVEIAAGLRARLVGRPAG
mgnify:CR=1 FL=1